MQIDPLLSLLIGALGAALLGLLGAWIQARREHAAWLRERRYEAHLAFLVLIDRYTAHSKLGQGLTTDKEIREAIQSLNEAISGVSMLGPETLLVTARTLREASATYIESRKEPPGFANSRVAYIVASRKATKIAN